MNDSVVAESKSQNDLPVDNPMVATKLAKDDLLYRVAHDLKNTLTAAHLTLTKVNLYRERMTDEQVDESVARALWTLNSMADTVSNIVRLNRIEEEVAAVMVDSAELISLTETYINQTRNIAKHKDIIIKTDFPSEPIRASLDPVYYQTILNNLISNAIKFSPPHSEVTVHLEKEGQKAKVSVIDKGQGLSQDDFKTIFSQFAKLSAKPTAGEASTGLGLYISQRLISAMNGTIEVHSDGKDKGSRFTLKFDTILS